jgi:carbamoyl-phosphate synthase large subunit
VGADEELQVLAGAADAMARDTGATIVTDTLDQISICQDKWKTFELLKRHGLPCAESALPEDEERFVREFGLPVVVKPREGHGSLHFYVARDLDELHRAISAIQEAGWRPFFQEYLPGVDQEYTSGVTVDRGGKNVLSSISMRRLLKGGQTFKAFVDDYKEVRRAAEEAAIKIGSHGPVNVQTRLVGDEPKIFEINPRFSASCPIRAVAGVNEPDIIFRNWILGEKIAVGSYRRLICLRYFNEVYVPTSVYEEAARTGRTDHMPDGSFIPDYF